MNDHQRTVVAIAVVLLLIAPMFFVPWRTGPESELQFAPIYRPPVSHVRSYASELHDTRYAYDEGSIAVDLLALEMAMIGLIGWAAYAVSADPAP